MDLQRFLQGLDPILCCKALGLYARNLVLKAKILRLERADKRLQLNIRTLEGEYLRALLAERDRRASLGQVHGCPGDDAVVVLTNAARRERSGNDGENGVCVMPNVRAEAGPAAKRQARAVENAPARRAGLAF